MRRVTLALLLAAVPYVATAQTPVPDPAVASMLAAFVAAPQQPQAYHAAVALRVKLRVFPFVHWTLHGESQYERPGRYRFTFHGVPIVAQAFSKMKYDLGDPKTWPEQYDIGFAPSSSAAQPVLRLAPRHAVQVRALDVAIDPAHGRILRATWLRKDGGTITLTQRYVAGNDGHDVVAQQDATIDLPRVKASLEAEYGNFESGTVGTIGE